MASGALASHAEHRRKSRVEQRYYNTPLGDNSRIPYPHDFASPAQKGGDCVLVIGKMGAAVGCKARTQKGGGANMQSP